MTNDKKTSAHYSPLTTHASLLWMGDPEDDDEEEEEKKKQQQEEDDEEDEDNEGEEEEVPWQVRAEVESRKGDPV